MTAAIKRKTKKNRKSLLFLIISTALVVAIFYAVYVLIAINIRIIEKGNQFKQINTQRQIVDEQNGELQRFADSGFQPEYSERIAREKLDYVYPDERVFYIVPGN